VAESERLQLILTGIDASASRALQAVGRQAMATSRRLANVGTSGAKMAGGLVAGVQVAAQVGSSLAQMGASAGILAPALLMGAQAMGTFKAVSEEASRQLEGLKPQFDGIKAAAAEAFRPGFAAALDTFASNLPVVKEGVRSTAKVFGELAERASAVFSGPAFRADLAAMMQTNTNATRSFGQAGIWLAGAFWDVAVAARGVWENFAGLVEIGAKSLGLWVEQKRESGALAAAITNGAREVGAFVAAIWNFGVGLKALFGAVSADSVSLSEKLFDLSLKFRAWATDADTLTTVTNLFQTFRDVAGAALDYVNLAVGAFVDGWRGANEAVAGEQGWLTAFRDLGEQARSLWTVISEQVLPALQSLGEVLLNDVLPPVLNIAGQLKETFVTALGAAAQVVEERLVPILRDDLAPLLRDVIAPAVERLATFFREKLIPALTEVANWVLAMLKPALDQLISSVERNKEEFGLLADALQWVGEKALYLAPLLIALTLPMWLAIGAAIAFVEILGFLIRQLQFVKEKIEEVIQWFIDLAAQFGITRDDIARIVNEIVAWFTELKQKVIEIFSDSGSWLEKAGRLIMLGLETGIQLGWSVLRVMILAIPTLIIGFFASAGTWLLQAGRNIVGGLIQGLGEKLGELRRKVGEIASAVKDFFPNSPAKTGPLKQSPPQDWGRNLMDYVGDGMRSGEAALRRQASSAAASLAFPVPAAPAAAGASGGGWVVNNYFTVNVAGSVATERRIAEALAPLVRNATVTDAGSNGRRTGYGAR
jgi:hypothetical protein